VFDTGSFALRDCVSEFHHECFCVNATCVLIKATKVNANGGASLFKLVAVIPVLPFVSLKGFEFLPEFFGEFFLTPVE
jgi:hypothetical protein